MDQGTHYDFRVGRKKNMSKKPLPPRGKKRLTPEQAYTLVFKRNRRAIDYLKDK